MLSNKLINVLLTLYIACFCYIAVQVGIYYYSSWKKVEPFPILLWWNSMSHEDRIIRCRDKYVCMVSSNRLHRNLGAFLFYGSRLENHDFPLPRNSSVWAVIHEESPKNYAPFLYKSVQQLFNLTSTFSRNSHFPVTLQYLRDGELLLDKKYYRPVEIKNTYLKNISPVLYIQSNCDTPIDRDHIIRKLSKYIDIDSYGECLKNKDFPEELLNIDSLDLYNEVYLQFISKYKFIIAIENAVCHDYITEKLWRPLIVGSIPVYYGSPSVRDFLPNEKSAIILNDFDSIATLGEFINKVNNNDSLYNEFLEHKILGKIRNTNIVGFHQDYHPISAFECFVCEKIHDKNFSTINENVFDCPEPKPKSQNNTWDQHWRIGRCQAEILSKLMGIGEPYSSDVFEENWMELLENKKC